MKLKTSTFLKQILSVLSSVAKAKSIVVKSKTSAMKTRLILFSLLKNKKVLMTSISHKIHALLGHKDNEDVGDQSNSIVLYNAIASESHWNLSRAESVEKIEEEEDDNDDKYPDLTHPLFDSDGECLENHAGSIIDLVRNSKEEGEDFSLEDEIDHVADLFIRRFHREMKMQKLASLKRYQEMLERSV